jgi:hypothetical protein
MGASKPSSRLTEPPNTSTSAGASPSDPGGLCAAISALERLDLSGLRLQWRNRWGRHAPSNLPRSLLCRVMAYRLQAEIFGDLDPKTKRTFDRLGEQSDAGKSADQPAADGDAESVTPDTRTSATSRAARDAPMVLKSGAVLSREWRGKMERVVTLEEGYSWNDRSYGSLSAVAFAITGTKWNGPRFFFGSKGRGKAHARSPTKAKAAGAAVNPANSGVAS